MNKKRALIGSGNAFFKDEGIGLYAVKYIKEKYSFKPEVDFVDGGTLGFLLMPLLQEFDEVMIVNTASDDEKNAGEITIKTCDEFLDGDLIKKTANEVEIAEMLQICSLTENMANTTVISIVPEDIISVNVGLSDSLKTAWPKYIKTILAMIEHSGVEIKELDDPMSLEEVLETFANPSIEYNKGF